jgi:membrane protein DedA with SNARE-associated domain
VIEGAVQWLADVIFRLGYPGIALLMAIESSFVPFPSELVLPPAGYLAAHGRMSAPLAFAAGLLGSLVGALVNYFLAVWLGRPFLHRYGRYFLVKEKSLIRAEQFFRRHGEISTFTGRLIPVIRQLISLPAGVSRMRLDRFLLFTAIGAGIWCAILTWIGWLVGSSQMLSSFDELLANPVFKRYSSIAALALVPLILVVLVGYVYWYRRRQAAAGKTGYTSPEIES